jgi:chemotaxis response regulator CheB
MTTSPALLRDLFRLDPDMVIIDLDNPSRDSLEQMFQIGRHVPRPVAMFVDQSDASMIEAAVEAVRYRLGQRQRFGVASAFLDERIEPGSRLRVHVQKAHGIVWPQGLARPAVKLGPGTGITPFCAFFQERAASQAMG